jgi:hypothetical protein
LGINGCSGEEEEGRACQARVHGSGLSQTG